MKLHRRSCRTRRSRLRVGAPTCGRGRKSFSDVERRRQAAPAPPESAGRWCWRNAVPFTDRSTTSRCGRRNALGRRCRKTRSPCRWDKRCRPVKPCWVSQLVAVAMSDAAGPNCWPISVCREPMVIVRRIRVVQLIEQRRQCLLLRRRPPQLQHQVRHRHGVVDAAAIVGGILCFRPGVAGKTQQVCRH